MELKITLDKKTLEVLEKLVEKIGVFPVPVSPETLQVIPQAVSPAVDPALQPVPQVVQPIPQATLPPTPEIIPAVGPATTQTVAAPVQAPTPQPAQTAQTVQTQAPVYTQQQLALAGTQLMDAGRQDEVVALLGQFGAQALTQLSMEQYGAFASGLRALGAKI